MARLILKIGLFYLEYSTVCDAPVTTGMMLEDFKAYSGMTHGEDEWPNIAKFVATADLNGSSRYNQTLRSELAGNRAGYNETYLTAAEIHQHYCLNQGKGDNLIGKSSSAYNSRDSTITADGKRLID